MPSTDLDAWTVIAWAIAVAWIAGIAVFVRSFRNRRLLRRPAEPCRLVETPRLSVIVAARNESDCIEACLRSLLQQDYPDLEVVAVNDRSSDGTAEILERLALEFGGRLRVEHVAASPAGWYGKPHALNLGLQNAAGSLICFTDADCEFESPAALRTTVAELLRRDLDLFSVTARYTLNSLRESVIVPCCAEAVLAWMRPARVNDPSFPDAFANGAFILVRREPFERIGGWGAVRTEISEDLQLARLAKRSGLRTGMAQGEGIYETRSYRTARESWEGWSRILNGVLTPGQLLMTLGRMLVMFVLPLGATGWGLYQALRGGNPECLMRGAWPAFAIALGLRCMLDVAMSRLVGAPVAAALLAPLGRLFVMAAATRALLSHAGLVHTRWRGTTFVAGRLVMPRPAKPEPHIP